MSNVTLTDNESKLLIRFAKCEMTAVNGAPEEATEAYELNGYVWLDEREVNGLSEQQLKGVLGSLVKKELVVVDKNCDDNTGDYLAFTDAGFEIVKTLI